MTINGTPPGGSFASTWAQTPDPLSPGEVACSIVAGTEKDEGGVHTAQLTVKGVKAGKLKLKGTYICPFTGQPASKEIEITIPKVDVDFEGLADEEEETVGGFLVVNLDDDDADGIVDKDDTQVVGGDNDLKQIVLQPLVPASLEGGTVTLSWSSANIKVYANSDKTGEIASGTVYQLADLPKTLYVEAIAPSDSPRDTEITLTYSSAESTQTDTLKVTLLKVELDIYPATIDAEQTHQISGDEAEIYVQATLFVSGKDESGELAMLPVENDTIVKWETDPGSASGGTLDERETKTEDGHTSVRLGTSRDAGEKYRVHAKVEKFLLEGVEVQNSDGSPLVEMDSGWMEVTPGASSRFTVQLTGDGAASGMPADGKSEKQLTVTIRDQNGELAAEGTEVYWRLKGAGELGEAQTSVYSNGQVTARLIAGDLVDQQEVLIETDGYEHVEVVENEDISISLTSDVGSLDMASEQTAALIATFSGLKDGATVVWGASKGEMINASTTVQNGQATATLKATKTRVGEAIVMVAVGGSSRILRIPFVSSAPIQVSVDQPVLAGDVSSDGTESVERIDGTFETVGYRTSTSVLVQAPSYPGRTATISFGQTVPNVLARYRMDQISNGATPDELGGRDAVVDGAVLDSAVVHEGAASMSFDGNGMLVVMHAEPLVIRDQLRISAWVYPEAPGGSLVAKAGEYELALDVEGKPSFTVHTANGSQTITAAIGLANGQWHFVSGRYDATGFATLTVNEMVTTQAITGSVAPGNNDIIMGSGFLGNLDLVEIGQGETFVTGLPLTLSGVDANGQVQLDATGQATVTVSSNGQFNPVQTPGHRVTIRVSVSPTEDAEEALVLISKEDYVRLQAMLGDVRMASRALDPGEKSDWATRLAAAYIESNQRAQAVFPFLSGSLLERSGLGHRISLWMEPVSPVTAKARSVFSRSVSGTTLEEAAPFNNQLATVLARAAAGRSDSTFRVLLDRDGASLIQGLYDLSGSQPEAMALLVRAVDGHTVWQQAEDTADIYDPELIEAIASLAKQEQFQPNFLQRILGFVQRAAPTSLGAQWKENIVSGMEVWLRTIVENAVNRGELSPDAAFITGYSWASVRLTDDLTTLADSNSVLKLGASLASLVVDAAAGNQDARDALTNMVPIIGTWSAFEDATTEWDAGRRFDAGIKTFNGVFAGVSDVTIVGGAFLKGTRFVRVIRVKKLPVIDL